MDAELSLPVPDAVTALYLVPGGPEADPEGALAARLDATPLRDLANQMLERGLARVLVEPAASASLPPDDLLLAMGAPREQVERLHAASHVLLVQTRFKPGWPPAHEWAARALAVALARAGDDLVLDVFASRLLDAEAAATALPTPQAPLRVVDWVVVPQSPGPGGHWLTTRGLGRFGLPELQACDVPPQIASPTTAVLTGLAEVLVRRWMGVLSEEELPAQVTLPLELELTARDIANAYGAEPRDDDEGAARIALRHDPAERAEEDDFLTLVAPAEAQAGSHGEWLTAVCRGLFGSEEQDTRAPRDPAAMERAIATARASLAEARRRFVGGELPLGDELLVKWRLALPGGGGEYVWAFVTDWPDAVTLRGTSANDADHDPEIRVGRPVQIHADDVVDWALWRGGELVEGGWTNAALDE